jgi:hypothetical protein
LGDIGAGQALHRLLQHSLGGGVGLHHATLCHIPHQHRISHGLKQQSVARFHVTQAQVIAFHGLVGIDQTPLHLRHTTQVATKQPELGVVGKCHRHDLQWHTGVGGAPQIDMPPGVGGVGFGRDKQLADFF